MNGGVATGVLAPEAHGLPLPLLPTQEGTGPGMVPTLAQAPAKPPGACSYKSQQINCCPRTCCNQRSLRASSSCRLRASTSSIFLAIAFFLAFSSACRSSLACRAAYMWPQSSLTRSPPDTWRTVGPHQPSPGQAAPSLSSPPAVPASAPSASSSPPSSAPPAHVPAAPYDGAPPAFCGHGCQSKTG